MAYGGGHAERQSQVPDEVPKFSRLFVIGDKRASEEDFRDAFKAYGTVQYVKAVRDRHTGESKGIFYIKMSKTSEAAKAVEEMHGTSLPGCSRPLKVLVACDRSSDEQLSDNDIMDQLMRLFIVVPKAYTESDIRDHFETFGSIKRVSILWDKNTGESRGLAFVRFNRASDCALAHENCSRNFRPMFADPQTVRMNKRAHESSPPPARRDHSSRSGEYGDDPSWHTASDDKRSRSSRMSTGQSPSSGLSKWGPFPDFMTTQPTTGPRRLTAQVSLQASQAQLTKLFGIVPGLENCYVRQDPAKGCSTVYVKYVTSQCCAYAKEAIGGFEYPPGHPLVLWYYEPEADGLTTSSLNATFDSERGALISPRHPSTVPETSREDSNQQNLINALVQNIQQAAQMLKARGLAGDLLGELPPGEGVGDGADSLDLPPPQPLAEEGLLKRRLFIVSSPTKIPLSVLKDMFCRFGDFINVTYMSGKNCGFARYASVESAEAAKAALHGMKIRGCLLKVLDAEDPPDGSSWRRSRTT